MPYTFSVELTWLALYRKKFKKEKQEKQTEEKEKESKEESSTENGKFFR